MSRAKCRSEARRKIRKRLRDLGWSAERIEAYVWGWERQVAEHYENGTVPGQPPKAQASWPKRRRAKLMARDPHCFYCGCEVVYFPLVRGQKMPANFATIDHVYSRIMGRPLKGETVLCCHKCNGDRSVAEQAALPKEELWRRSGRPPLALREAEAS